MINKIGVRDLVEFTLKSGDLNSKLNSDNTAQKGAKIHRKLQKKHGKEYQAEVPLAKNIKMNNINFQIDGRIDGLILKENQAEIEEIKTSDTIFEDLPNSILQLYWGQAQAYAYLLMDANPKIKKATLKLTYVQTPDEQITVKFKEIGQAESKQFFQSLINEYEEWLKLRSDIVDKRNKSAQAMKFPFTSFRKGQRELSAAVYKTIAFNKHLFAQAPTGTGKTISTLFPAIKGMGEKLCNRIFYLTAKQSTQSIAENTMNLMANKDLYIKSITITSKEKITFDEEKDLKPEDNPYMVGYYDRLKPAIKKVLENENQITRNVVQKYAKKYTLDPFEFSLDLSLFCDVIIGDYNYLFDPQVYLQRFFAVEDSNNVFLIDEAHNLVDRSRDMYSAELSDSKLNELIKMSKNNPDINDKLHRALKSFKQSFNINTKVLKDNNVDQINITEPLDAFNKQVNKLVDKIHAWLKKDHPEDKLNDEVLEYYFKLLHYQKINEYYDDTYKTRIYHDYNNNTIIKLFCMDPSPHLSESLQLGGSAILFSATLSPMNYYQRVLGHEDDSLAFEIESPFPINNQQLISTNYIETTYKQRNNSINLIIESIFDIISSKKGHYIIFAPSNKYLLMIVEAFEKRYPHIQTTVQKASMDDNARQSFIDQFKNDKSENLVGFALLGGIFSEGIDLKYDALIGVGIVSVGLPGLSAENNLIRDYFDKENGHGFEYAYQLPGLNNVMQAAGRLIRTNHDLGNIMLMDRRFSQQRYQKFFPNNWNVKISYNKNNTKTLIDNFWNNKK
ncbi:ATP-dependent DNA helicase [Apilactobacillus micheneri]|uniref:ATP-dependent DNA helicase n=1 Tax=Apilactobacillus micheneri TaxID=1899430 RepID=UPI00112C3AAF|nr:ATP-dependent DNA helicase [Apilactobacillus micheneri]